MCRTQVLGATLGAALLLTLMPSTALAFDGAKVTVDCVSPNADGTFNAIFGYDNTLGQQFSIPLGEKKERNIVYTNVLSPARLQGQQVSTFNMGANRAAFAVKFNAAETVTWTVGYDPMGNTPGAKVAASATKNSTPCTTGPALPAEGNGMGGILVLCGAAVTGTFMFLYRRIRYGSRS